MLLAYLPMRVAAVNKNAYVSHNLADPTYPKTVIIPNGVNNYDIQYAHGRPLSDFTIEDCPDSVFNYNCQYYKSLISLKQMYEANITAAKRKLEAHDEELLSDYINKNVDDVYKRTKQRINKSIDKLSSYHAEDIVRDISNDATLSITARDITELEADISADLADQQYALSSVEDEVIDELTEKWYKIYQTTPESKQSDEQIYLKWVSSLGELENEIKHWKSAALEEAIEYEKIQISEFNAIPHNGKDFRNQLRKLTTKLISDLTQDVKNSAFDVIYTKLPKSVIDKYKDQLNAMIMLHKRCKLYSMVDSFMNTFKLQLNSLLGTLNIDDFVDATDWYELKKYLFPIVETCIQTMARTAFTELNDRLTLLPKYNDYVTNIQYMNRVSNDIVNAINNAILDVDLSDEAIAEEPMMSKIADAIDVLNAGYSDNVKRCRRKPSKAVHSKNDL